MSDLERVTRTDQSVDSLPHAPETSQAQGNYLPSPADSPRIPGRTSNRVTVGYFDREGVDQLRRTLTHLSETYDPENARALSSETLSIPAAGPFDFEKTLRTIMKKYVIASHGFIICHLVWHQTRPCRYSIARARCPVQRSSRCRLGCRRQFSANLWLNVQPQGHSGEDPDVTPSSLARYSDGLRGPSSTRRNVTFVIFVRSTRRNNVLTDSQLSWEALGLDAARCSKRLPINVQNITSWRAKYIMTL